MNEFNPLIAEKEDSDLENITIKSFNDDIDEDQPATQKIFQPLHKSNDREISKADIDRILDVPVQLTAELGRTRMTIKSFLQLSQGSIVELDALAGEPMDIFINGYLIAQGEVVVIKEKYGIRLTDIVTPSERIRKLKK
jgi:flagellar motor switch protein FliN/FliY